MTVKSSQNRVRPPLAELSLHQLSKQSKTLERFPLSSFSHQPGDFRSWESPQTMPALFTGPSEYEKRFPRLKFALKSITLQILGVLS